MILKELIGFSIALILIFIGLFAFFDYKPISNKISLGWAIFMISAGGLIAAFSWEHK